MTAARVRVSDIVFCEELSVGCLLGLMYSDVSYVLLEEWNGCGFVLFSRVQ